MAITELSEMIRPIVRQALWQTVGRLSITDLTGADAHRNCDAFVAQQLLASFKRYGLKFGQVQTISIRHGKYDEHHRLKGEVWLLRENQAARQELDKLYNEEELRKVKQAEQANDLDLLAKHAEAGHLEGKVAVAMRRFGIRRELRKAILSDKMAKLKDENDWKRFLSECDKDELFRKEEMDELVRTYQTQREDKELLRQHIVDRLAVEQAYEIESIRADLNQRIKRKTQEHEIELSRRTESEENRRWREMLQRQAEEAEHQRQEADKALRSALRGASAESGHRREEQWHEVLHAQRLDRIKGEVESERAERQIRVRCIEDEYRRKAEEEKRLFDERLADSKRKQQAAGMHDKLGALEELNRINAERDRVLQELREREQRLKADLEGSRQDQHFQRELERLRLVASMGYEAMIATTGEANAQILAELKKHETMEVVARAGHDAEAERRLAEQQKELLQQQLKREQEFSQQRADDARRHLDSAENMAGMGYQALSQASKPTPGQTPPPGPCPGAPPGIVGAKFCANCGARLDGSFRFCPACGAATVGS
jgi:hypothetical protein